MGAIGEIMNEKRLATLTAMKKVFTTALEKNDPKVIEAYLKEGENALAVLSVLTRAVPIEYQTYVRYAELNSSGEEEAASKDYPDFVLVHLEATIPLLERWVRDLERSDELGKLLMVYVGDPDPAVRKSAAYSLARIDYQPAISQLLILLKDPDHWVRDAAVLSLSHLGEKAVSPIALAMKSESPASKILLLDALARITGGASEAVIEEYLDDPDKNVRRAAKQALDVLRPQ
jgi:hypothetical protein